MRRHVRPALCPRVVVDVAAVPAELRVHQAHERRGLGADVVGGWQGSLLDERVVQRVDRPGRGADLRQPPLTASLSVVVPLGGGVVVWR